MKYLYIGIIVLIVLFLSTVSLSIDVSKKTPLMNSEITHPASW